MCRSAQSSFGLPPDKIYLYEEVYTLVEKCGLRYDEAWDMPVAVRHWWIKRKQKDSEPQNPGGPPPGMGQGRKK